MEGRLERAPAYTTILVSGAGLTWDPTTKTAGMSPIPEVLKMETHEAEFVRVGYSSNAAEGQQRPAAAAASQQPLRSSSKRTSESVITSSVILPPSQMPTVANVASAQSSRTARLLQQHESTRGVVKIPSEQRTGYQDTGPLPSLERARVDEAAQQESPQQRLLLSTELESAVDKRTLELQANKLKQDSADRLKGQDSADRLKGQDSSDRLKGQDSADRLKGQDSAERLKRQELAERLSGQDPGQSRLSGQDTGQRLSGQDTGQRLNQQSSDGQKWMSADIRMSAQSAERLKQDMADSDQRERGLGQDQQKGESEGEFDGQLGFRYLDEDVGRSKRNIQTSAAGGGSGSSVLASEDMVEPPEYAMARMTAAPTQEGAPASGTALSDLLSDVVKSGMLADKAMSEKAMKDKAMSEKAMKDRTMSEKAMKDKTMSEKAADEIAEAAAMSAITQSQQVQERVSIVVTSPPGSSAAMQAEQMSKVGSGMQEDASNTDVKWVQVHRSGDQHSPGVRVPLSKQEPRNFLQLLDLLTARMGLPVQHLYTADGLEVSSLATLLPREVYVASGAEGFRPVQGGYRAIQDEIHRKQMLQQKLSQMGGSQTGKVSHPSLAGVRSVYMEKVEELQPQPIYLYRNGDRFQPAVRCTIPLKDFRNLDKVMEEVNSKLYGTREGFCDKLYTMEGEVMKSARDLRAGGFYVAGNVYQREFEQVPYGEGPPPTQTAKPTERRGSGGKSMNKLGLRKLDRCCRCGKMRKAEKEEKERKKREQEERERKQNNGGSRRGSNQGSIQGLSREERRHSGGVSSSPRRGSAQGSALGMKADTRNSGGTRRGSLGK